MDGHLQHATLELPESDLLPRRAGAYAGHVDILGKAVRVDVSRAALKALSRHGFPLIAEMELYFSCLIRKQVLFREFTRAVSQPDDCSRVIPGLYATFRAVTTKHCRVADVTGKPPVEAMPVKKPRPFVPDWLSIDFRAGQWRGEYGFSRSL